MSTSIKDKLMPEIVKQKLRIALPWIILLWICAIIGALIAATSFCLALPPIEVKVNPPIKYRGISNEDSERLARIEEWTHLHSEDQMQLHNTAAANRALIDINSNRLTRLETQYDGLMWWCRVIAVGIITQLMIAAFGIARKVIDSEGR